MLKSKRVHCALPAEHLNELSPVLVIAQQIAHLIEADLIVFLNPAGLEYVATKVRGHVVVQFLAVFVTHVLPETAVGRQRSLH